MLAKLWKKYIAINFENGKNKLVIKDESGNIINENPTKEDMDGLFYYYFNIKPILRLPNEKCKRYLLEFIKHWYRENGDVPEILDFNKNPKYPSFNVYKKVFGSWDNAIKEAGLIPNCGGFKEKIYTVEDLLEYQIKWYEEHNEPPTIHDFTKDPKYPGIKPYYERLGGWQTSLKMLGLNIDSLARRGIIRTSDQKGRLGEIFIFEHFEEIGAIDLAKQNSNIHLSDGICPKGYNYDVKTSKFYVGANRWHFKLYNINKEIVYVYLLGFNEDFTELIFSWRIPIYKFSENRKNFRIYSKDYHYRGPTKYNIENMRQYEITDKILPIFEKWLEKVKKQDNSKDAIVREARERLKTILENKEKDQIFKRDCGENYEEDVLKIPKFSKSNK